jgi:glucans biosynthesis protein C
MSSLSEHATSEIIVENISSIQSPPQMTNRMHIYFLDHLRVALMILVVLHHLAVIYGANASFYYVEAPGPKDRLAFLLLLVFVLINQAYFMGFFFLISGYFTPGSFDRKGPGNFYKDRLLRLGIPMIAYALVLSPIASISPYLSPMPGDFFHLTPPATWQQFPDMLGVGPLWFAEMLLFFCLGYIVWRRVRRVNIQSTDRIFAPPSYRAIGLFILALALATYVLRIVVPMGTFIPLFGFPSLAYLPQYLSFFILGIIAFRQNWLETISGSLGKTGFVVAGLSTIVIIPLEFSSGLAFLGHGSWQSAFYALWDSAFSVGMCLGLITLFRRYFNRQTRFGRFLSQQAFTVYIIHIPVIVLLALTLRDLHPGALPKFALAALIGVPLCFMIAFLVRKLPFASRIL